MTTPVREQALCPTALLRISSSRRARPNALILAFAGDIDISTTAHARHRFAAHYLPPHVVIDLSRIGFSAAAGIDLLLDLGDDATRRASALHLAGPTIPLLPLALGIAGLADRLLIHPTLDAALDHITAS